MNKDRDLEEKEQNVDESFDLTGLLLEYLGNWKWFVLSAIIGGIVAYFYIATIIPIYQVSASIYLSDETSSSKSADAVSVSGSVLLNQKDYIDETEIEILKSRNSLIKIVDSLDLAYSYAEIGRFRDVPIYGTNGFVASLDSVSLRNLSSQIEVVASKEDNGYLFSISTGYGGNVETKNVTAKKLPAKVELSQGTLTLSESKITKLTEKPQKVTIKNPSWVAARLAGSLGISFAHNSSTILRISFRTPVVREGVDVINALIAFYNADIIEDKNRSAMQTEAFILDRLVLISSELKDVEQRLMQYRQANNIINLEAQASMNLANRDETEAQLADVAAQQKILSSVEESIARQDNYTTIAQVVDNSALSSQIDAYNRKVAQRDRLLEGSTEDNPIVKEMQEDLNRQKSTIMQGIRSAQSNLGVRRSSIAAQGSRSSGQLASLPPIDKGLQEIFREQQVKVNIYTFLLQKREEIALQKTLATPTARLIDNPSSGGAVYPMTSSIYGLAIIIGLLIPGLLILLRRMIFPVFKDKEELERFTTIPVLSEIGQARGMKDNVVINEQNDSAEAELFRLLRNNTQFVLGKDKKVIMVTSSLSGEGKTFLAVNMAMSFALTGKKVLVVGMDIRRPRLAHVFGLSNRVGLTTYLCGHSDDVDSMIFRSEENENLYVMPAGPVPPNPNELLLSDRLDAAINHLRDEFDYILVDTAPIGLVSDSLLIARTTDIQVYVARANYSTRKCLKMLNGALQSGRFSNVYLVLNGVDMRSNAYRYRRYGSYGVYGSKKGYGYGYGYSDEPSKDKKKRLFGLFGRGSHR